LPFALCPLPFAYCRLPIAHCKVMKRSGVIKK
jgi:hypothetical protein